MSAHLPPPNDTERDVIQLGTDEHRCTELAILAISKHPAVFQRGGQLVHVLRDSRAAQNLSRPAGAPYIATIAQPRLRELLSERIEFQQWRRKEFVPAHPADWLVKQVHARGEWKTMRHLEAVTETPFLRADGAVVDRAGYDAASGVLLASSAEFPPVPQRPSREEAAAGVEVLCDVLSDFPFGAPEHRSAALAGILTPLARFAFAGPAPLFLITKNVHGAGGSLLADAISVAATGRAMARMTQAADENEERKRILAIAMAGDPMVLIDNVDQPLGGAALDAALTGTEWRDRVLGRTEMVTAPLLATWFATGNNPVVKRDTLRRTLPCRLETSAERPEERSGFKYDPLLQHVVKMHPRLASAALTVLRAYHVAGRPDVALKPWGSFEGWSALIRGALVWAGQTDPALGRQQLTAAADTEAAALRVLLENWRHFDSTGSGVSTARIIESLTEGGSSETAEALREAVNELSPPAPGKTLSARSLGRNFMHLKGRVVNGRALDCKPGRLGQLWFVREVTNG